MSSQTTKIKKNDDENSIEKSDYFSKIGFMFIIFVVVSSGYISEILSCQMRYTFESNPYFRHFIGTLMFFIFIMLEGGWSFDTKNDEKFPNNWASGNVIDTAIMSFCLYFIFLLSSKSNFTNNILFFSLILLLYLINTQRNYMFIRESINKNTNDNLLFLEYGIAILSIITLVYGVIDYFMYQSISHKRGFSLEKFLLGAHKCKSVERL
jgi:hypothetical protein